MPPSTASAWARSARPGAATSAATTRRRRRVGGTGSGNRARENLRITGPMTDPSRPLWVLLLIPLVAAACTAANGGDAPRTAPATKAPTPRGWMLSSGQVFGKGLIATHLPDGDPQRMGLPNDAVVFDAAWVQ